MKRTYRGWIHLAGAALAFAITLAVKRAGAPDVPPGVEPVPAAAPRGESAASRERSVLSGRPAEELAAAWQGLAARRLPRGDRFAMQVAILRSWAEKDLAGALEAALSEPWDEEVDQLLREGIGQAFLDRPGDSWRMIQEKRFGLLGSALVRNAWASVLQEENPELFYTYLPEMEGMALRSALAAASNHLENREQAERLWGELAKKSNWLAGDAEIPDGLAMQLGVLVSTETMLEAMRDPDSPMAGMAASAYANKLNFRDEGREDFASELAKVPPEAADRFAFESLKLAWGDKQRLFDAFDHLVEAEQWGYLSQSTAGERVKELAKLTPPEALAEWVADLPPRAETAEMFHRGVEPFIQKDPEAAWEWISGLEDGYWRDRAFAEYSQQSLNRFKDPAKSREALDHIQDPTFKQTAESWRKSWARNHGLPDG